MADTVYGDINMPEITSVFDSYTASMITTIEASYTDTEMSPEMYAKTIASALKGTLDLSAKQVQNQPLLEAQTAKAEKDTDFVEAQEQALIDSVYWNNRIKALETYAALIATMGAGGLVISQDMWKLLYDMLLDLNPDILSVPTDVATRLVD